MGRWRAVAGPALLLVLVAPAGLVVGASPAGASGGGGCGGPLTERRGTVVRIKQFCFTPTVLRVPVGARVTFINLDPFAHTVLGANGAWGSYEPLVTGPPPTYVFRHAGVYPYACTIHPGMVGTIVAGRVPATKGLQTLSSSVEPVPELARAVTTAAADPKVPSPVGAPGWRMAAAAEALFILIVGAVAVERGRAKPGPHLP